MADLLLPRELLSTVFWQIFVLLLLPMPYLKRPNIWTKAIGVIGIVSYVIAVSSNFDLLLNFRQELSYVEGRGLISLESLIFIPIILGPGVALVSVFFPSILQKKKKRKQVRY